MASPGTTSAAASLRAYRRRPGPETRRAVIEAHLPLVDQVARRMAASGERHDDLVQAGRVGLIKAVDRYDPARGELAPFALPFIDGEIRHHLRDETAAVKTPRAVRDLGVRARRAQTDLAARHGHHPSGEELAHAVGAPAADVQGALGALAAALPLTLDSGGSTSDDPDTRLALETALATLAPRDRRIVELRYLEDRAQVDIARDVGLSTASVSRILHASLETLRTALTDPVEPARPPAYAAPMATRAGARADGEAARSGRVLVRMPQSLHEDLVEEAEREGVSLNAFVTGVLAAAVHWRDDPPGATAPERTTAPARTSRWAFYATILNVVVVVLAAAVAIVLLAGAL